MSDRLAGKRILVVEDEYFIASDLKRALAGQQVALVGPVGDLATGLALAQTEPLDAAILDVNLEGAQSFPIADELMARGIPFAFLTGYDRWALPTAYRGAVRLSKPFAAQAVVQLAERLCAETRVA